MIVTVAITVALLSLTFVRELRTFLTRLGVLAPIRYPVTDFRTAPFPVRYVLPFK